MNSYYIEPPLKCSTLVFKNIKGLHIKYFRKFVSSINWKHLYTVILFQIINVLVNNLNRSFISLPLVFVLCLPTSYSKFYHSCCNERFSLSASSSETLSLIYCSTGSNWFPKVTQYLSCKEQEQN